MSRKNRKATETATDTSGTTSEPRSIPTSGPLAFTAPKRELARIVKQVGAATDRKSSIAMLGYIALRASVEGVRFAGTDLNHAMVVHANAPTWSVQGVGGMAVPAKGFADLLRKLPEGPVTVRGTDHGIVLVAGSAEVVLRGLPDRDFPKLPMPITDDDPVWARADLATVDAETLRELLASVAFAVSQDPTRFHLNGTCLLYDGADAIAITTDGHRLAKSRRFMTGAWTREPFTINGVILPANGCELALGMLAKVGTCDMGILEGRFFMRRTIGGITTTLSVKCIDAQFPPYEQVIPKAHRRLLTVNRASLVSALELAKRIAGREHGTRFEVTGTDLALVTENSDAGTVREVLTGTEFNACDGFRIGLNPSYLLDAIRDLDADRVTIAFSDDESPCKYTDKQDKVLTYQLEPMLVRGTEDTTEFSLADARYLCVIMPMRI